MAVGQHSGAGMEWSRRDAFPVHRVSCALSDGRDFETAADFWCGSGFNLSRDPRPPTLELEQAALIFGGGYRFSTGGVLHVRGGSYVVGMNRSLGTLVLLHRGSSPFPQNPSIPLKTQIVSTVPLTRAANLAMLIDARLLTNPPFSIR